MKLWAFADFKPDFPDDQEDDGDEIIVLGGRGVSEAIAAMLNRLGYGVSAPEQTPPYGWRFDVCKDRYRIMFQVTDLGEEFALGTYDRSPLLARLFGASKRAHAKLLTGLASQLSKDGRFRDLTWWDRYDARGVASDQPVTTR